MLLVRVTVGCLGVTLPILCASWDDQHHTCCHVVQTRTGRPSFRGPAAGVKRFEGAAFVETNFWKGQECESGLSAIFIWLGYSS